MTMLYLHVRKPDCLPPETLSLSSVESNHSSLVELDVDMRG